MGDTVKLMQNRWLAAVLSLYVCAGRDTSCHNAYSSAFFITSAQWGSVESIVGDSDVLDHTDYSPSAEDHAQRSNRSQKQIDSIREASHLSIALLLLKIPSIKRLCLSRH